MSRRLEVLLRRQRTLSWVLSASVFAVTVGFFALMGTNSSVMRRVVWGRGVTVANVAAAAIIVLFFVSIAVYGHLADRIDQARAHSENR